MASPSILFVFKNRNDPFAEVALTYVRQHFPRHQTIFGTQGDDLPDAIRTCRADYLVSYLSPWIIPQSVLDNIKIASINFHPGPPEYPGIGCYNFAHYDQVSEYGVTCHHMVRSVDSGKIIAVRRFPILESDNVSSIARQASVQMLVLFFDMMSCLSKGNPLPVSDEVWRRKPYTRSDMYELFRITTDMSEAEVERRIKAAEFPGWPGAYIELHGRRFYLPTPDQDI
jgi:methionyl-tRNA formyltransferase